MATVDLRQLIINEANSQGVPPAIALAVASQESGIMQWWPNGSLKTGSKGEIGVFQLMPATAAMLGVDPTDVVQNIRGGVAYLKQMFNQFGDWSLALAAYNWGPNKVAKSGGAIPGSVQSYVNSIGMKSGMLDTVMNNVAAVATTPVDLASDAVVSLADATSAAVPDSSTGKIVLFAGLAFAALLVFMD